MVKAVSAPKTEDRTQGKRVATEGCSRVPESSGTMLCDPVCRSPGVSVVSTAFTVDRDDLTLTQLNISY